MGAHRPQDTDDPNKAMNILLWIIQSLLSLLFIFAGVMKFLTPIAEMQKGTPIVLPGWFFYFIGICEVLGGIGLILPALLRIKPGLTPLAATGLGIITLGATVITATAGISLALIPFVVCLLSFFVAFGRWRLAPVHAK
ncbi:MAG TPA: DoxX family protein [Pyrinomonadaceae bacterium]|jgi:uncharacterized membrane protein YphA (DoxX/SURF4 family)|nr:DoxX family protein [Pyrinomonadaceae bacterium]